MWEKVVRGFLIRQNIPTVKRMAKVWKRTCDDVAFAKIWAKNRGVYLRILPNMRLQTSMLAAAIGLAVPALAFASPSVSVTRTPSAANVSDAYSVTWNTS